jgi:hypothetical protein
MSEKGERTSVESGISQRSAELVVALLTMVAGLTVAIASYQLGARWGSDGPQAGYFPFYVGLFICIGSAVNFLAGLSMRTAVNTKLFVSWLGLRRVAAVFVPAMFYVAGIYLVGIYVSSLFYIAGFMVLLGKYRLAKSLAIGFGVSIALFFMFEIWFQVLLPKGAYNILSFVGH